MKPSNVACPGVYDRNLFLQKKQTSRRLDAINPKVVCKLFSSRPSFEYIKDVALERFEKTLLDQLEVLALDEKCNYAKWQKYSKNIFSWGKRDYLRRRALKNCLWIDVIDRNTESDCLERYKLQTDLREVKKYIKILFQSSKIFGLENLFYKPLRETQIYLDILNILNDEREMLRELFRQKKLLVNAKIVAKRTSKERNLLGEVEGIMAVTQLYEAIEARFQINWYKCKTEQAQTTCDINYNGIRKEIEGFEYKIFSEKIAGDTICDTYYSLSEQFKSEIDELQNKFNNRLDEIENKISYTELEIFKLKQEENALKREIESFHERIEARLELEETRRQQEEMERLRLEAEKAALALEMAAKKAAKKQAKKK